MQRAWIPYTTIFTSAWIPYTTIFTSAWIPCNMYGINALLYLLVHGIHMQRVPEVLAVWIPGWAYGFQAVRMDSRALDFLWILIMLVTGLLHFGLSKKI